jgi:asparagine synthase (glutamine-hydrolysing)
MKIRDGKGKWLLRQVLHKHVPAEMFERPKQGFAMTVGEWLRGGLKDWAEDLLSEDRLKNDGFLKPEPVRAMWTEHLQGNGNHATSLWTVLCFQAWRERWK